MTNPLPFDRNDPQMCGVCARLLNYYGKDGWGHADLLIQYDHPAVPVSIDERQVLGLCDFCNGENPTHTLRVNDFTTDGWYHSVGDWAACDECAEDIKNNKWTRLVIRYKNGFKKKHGFPLPAEGIHKTWELQQGCKQNVVGPIEKVVEWP